MIPAANDSSAAATISAAGRGLCRVKHLTTELSGWRRWGVATSLGAIAAAALPPVHAVVLLVPTLTGLLWLIESGRGIRSAFAAGWWFGVGHFVVGFYWVAHSFLVDAARYGWLAPFAVAGLAASLALFPAAAAALSRWSFRFAVGSPPGRLLLSAAAWTALEWARGWILTGLPWNLIGSAWSFSVGVSQLAAVTGVYGLSLITFVVGASPALAIDGGRYGGRQAAVAFIVFGLLWLGGLARLPAEILGHVEGVRLRLVQPNIPQHLKWKPDLRAEHVRDLIRLSRQKPADDLSPTHILWPETAVPFNLVHDPALLALLGGVVPADGLLITGAPRTSAPGDPEWRVWNSLHAIAAGGVVAATYDKVHLVPFGEYIPFRSVLRFGKLTQGRVDFTPGDSHRPLILKGLPPVSALICFEVIFAGEVVDRDNRPQWFLNITNDAWFGNSGGPYQHLAAARMRAIEQGLPLVRVSNTGISAIIGPYGRSIAELPLNRAGVIDAGLPAALALPPYGRFGDGITALLVLFTAAAGALFAGGRPPWARDPDA